jgi:hypothetical protein
MEVLAAVLMAFRQPAMKRPHVRHHGQSLSPFAAARDITDL